MTLEEALSKLVAQHASKPEHKAVVEDIAQQLKAILDGHLPYGVRAVYPVDSVMRGTALLPLEEVNFWAVLDLPEANSALPGMDQVLSHLEPSLNDALGAGVRRGIRSIEFPSTHIRNARIVPAIWSRKPNSTDDIWTVGDEGWSLFVPGGIEGGRWLPAHPSMLEQDLGDLETRSGGTLRDLVRLIKLWNNALQPNLSRYHIEVMLSRIPNLPTDSLLSGFEASLSGLSNVILEPCPDPNVEGLFADYSVTPHFKERLSRLMRRNAQEVAQARLLEKQGRSEDAHAVLGRILGEAYPVKPVAKTPVLLNLNAWGDIDPHELKKALADRTAERTIRWKEEGGGPALPPPSTNTGSFPWEAAGLAVRRMSALADGLRRDPAAGPLDLQVTGLAPLPLFVQLGLELSPWSGPIRLLNRRKDGQWDRISLGGGAEPIRVGQIGDVGQGEAMGEPPPFFDVITGLQKAGPSKASGRVVIFISTIGGNLPRDLFTSHLEARQQPLAGLVEIRSLSALVLNSTNAVDAFNVLSSTLSSLRNAYPNATGFSIVVAGPASLAFLVGRALNPTILGEIEVWNFEAGKYAVALNLPFQGGIAAGPSLALRRLDLSGFRGFAQLSLTFSSRCVVLVGANGSGKSSILHALTLMLSAVAKVWSGSRWSPALNRTDVHKPGARQAKLGLTVELAGQTIPWHYAYSPSDLRIEVSALWQELEALRQRYPGDEALNLPIMVYYPVQRAIPEKSFRSRSVNRGDLPGLSQFAAWEDALGEGESNFRAFFLWFKEREDLENKRKVANAHHQDPQLNAVRRALKELLPGFDRPSIERSPLRMEVYKGDIAYDVRQLSDGEKITLALTADLARRLAIANPSLTNPLQGSGVVLIDEVELHLHPGWQRKIVPRLLETFPRCQFILTTHSPQVLGELKDAQAFVLTSVKGHQAGYGSGTTSGAGAGGGSGYGGGTTSGAGAGEGSGYGGGSSFEEGWKEALGLDSGIGTDIQVSEIRAPYGWDSNLILESLMESDERTSDVKQRLEHLMKLIEKKDVVAARAEYESLAAQIGRETPDMVGAEVRLRWLEVARR